MTDSEAPTVHLPSREIPAPSSLSSEARALMAVKLPETPPYPALDDLEAWRSRVAGQEAVMRDLILERVAGARVQVEEMEAAGVPVYVVTPDGTAVDDRRVFLSVHGGGFIGGAGVNCRAMGIGDALQMGVRTWAVDYRMPPDDPYPAPLDDCVAVYDSMLQDYRPEDIVVGGASAGGNLAAALLLRARDAGLPLPAAAVLRTPEIDLTESGDSFQTNLGLDNLLTESLLPANLLYAAGHDLRDPYLSPCSATSPRASRPPSSPRVPGICSCRTPFSFTGPCGRRMIPAGVARPRRGRPRRLLRHGARGQGSTAGRQGIRRSSLGIDTKANDRRMTWLNQFR